MRLRPARPADIPVIRAIVQRPENFPCLTDEDDAALMAYLADPTARVLVWQGESPRGFAILSDLDDPARSFTLLRLALAEPGRGEGRPFLRALIEHAFGPLGARRLWLDTTADNLRAQAAYRRAGFTLEGRLRQHEYRPATGRITDVLLYGLLREEWQALPASV